MSESVEWRKSSHSDPHNDCVEVAVGREVVRVRDSKSPDTGELSFGSAQFAAFRRYL